MMEIEQFSYIFGSFSRRKPSSDFKTLPSSSSSKRRSVEATSPTHAHLQIHHDRSKSNPFASELRSKNKIVEDTAALKCTQCAKHFIEPRVLPCLHTFCTSCLHQLAAPRSPTECDSSSGSGYVSDKCNNGDDDDAQDEEDDEEDGEDAHGLEDIDRSINGGGGGERWHLTCPQCNVRHALPDDGVLGLPLNYLILHRIVLATLNSPSTKLLCDACPAEVVAKARCTQCALSLCRACAEAHANTKPSGWHPHHQRHEILDLEEARRRGISKVRRQVMCQRHPEHELNTFCAACSQIICTQCSVAHKDHTLEPAAKAAKTQTSNILVAMTRARALADKSQLTTARLEASAQRITNQCNQIEAEIDRFTASYVRAVEAHRERLFAQLRQAREEKLCAVDQHRSALQSRCLQTDDAIRFASELLRDGSEIEVLSFVAPIMRQLKVCDAKNKADGELKISESLQFLPEEVVVSEDAPVCCPLYGVITTQTISVRQSVLHTGGMQNLRVGRRAEAVLETRDSGGAALQRGGEAVEGELRHRDGGTARTLPVHIVDRRDGTYLLQFVPDVAGKLFLHVAIKGEALKDSPFAILVRSLRPHHGTFHCCTFCSSGGSKEAACGCHGRMPGGYKGCGHGHDGHPGRRHWSCCGNVLEHSECVRTNSITHYQFTL